MARGSLKAYMIDFGSMGEVKLKHIFGTGKVSASEMVKLLWMFVRVNGIGRQEKYRAPKVLTSFETKFGTLEV